MWLRLSGCLRGDDAYSRGSDSLEMGVSSMKVRVGNLPECKHGVGLR